MNLDQPSPRAYTRATTAFSWEEIWEAGPYYDRISDLLEKAQFYAILAGWQIDSRLLLKKRSETSFETLREKIIRLCQEKPDFQIYFLLWDHAYLYVLERETWQGRIWANIHPRVYFIFDNKHPFGASHHEKVVIIDGTTALCGGIDLCGERWDSPQHLYSDPRRSLHSSRSEHGPYHDMAVQVTGPICSDIHSHIAKRWLNLSSIPFPAPVPMDSFSIRFPPTARETSHRVYLSRTIAQIDQRPRKISLTREVEFLFRDLIFLAKKRIIMEGQYYWSRTINDILITKIQRMKGTDFEIIVILSELNGIKSLTRKMMSFELSLIRTLQLAAIDAGVKLTIGSPYVWDSQPGTQPKPVYIHSKVIIVDDLFFAVGSTNFADRALRIDTEIHLTFEAKDKIERAHIRDVANQILNHWKLRPAKKYFDRDTKSYLRPFKPLITLGYNYAEPNHHPIISWQHFFDPPIPWLYPFQIKIRKIMRRKEAQFFYHITTLWFTTVSLIWMIFHSSLFHPLSKPTVSYIRLPYVLLFSSVWLLPVPFVLTSLLAVVHLGSSVAAKIGLTSLWVASIFGYYLARIFPGLAARYCQDGTPLTSLEKRKFSGLIGFLADPRFSIQKKIIYPGLFCTPLPWFLAGTCVLFSSIIYFFLKYLAPVLDLIFPVQTLVFIKKHSPFILGILFTHTLIKANLLWKKKE